MSKIPASPAGLVRHWYCALGTAISLRAGRRLDQRGLSQSTENAVLLTGAVGIAITVIAIVGRYVGTKLGALG